MNVNQPSYGLVQELEQFLKDNDAKPVAERSFTELLFARPHPLGFEPEDEPALRRRVKNQLKRERRARKAKRTKQVAA